MGNRVIQHGLINLVWLSSWFSFFLLLGRIRIDKRFSGLLLVTAFLLLIATICLILVNPTLAPFANYSLLVLVLAASFKIRRSHLSVVVARIFFYMGIFSAAILYTVYGGRVGLYGWEPNFTGFWVWVFFVLLLQRGRFLEPFIAITIMILMCLSKALFLGGILTILMYFLKDRRKISFLIYISVIFMLIFFHLYDPREITILAPLFRGYIEDTARLFYIFDSSALQRLDLVNYWFSYFLSQQWPQILLGDSIDFYASSMMIPHNSFVQKAISYGVVFVVIMTLACCLKLPMWVSLPYLVYSATLHSVLSPSILLVLMAVCARPIHHIAIMDRLRATPASRPQKLGSLKNSHDYRVRAE